jgi:sialate O-acetylesterase
MKTLFSLLALLVASAALADVRLPAVLGEHMVLQRGGPVRIWGYAEDNESVRVTFRGRTASTVARNGRWEVAIAPGSAGGPFSLSIEGKNRIELTDVLVGEVWVCSGQSNMQWAMRQSFEPDRDIAASANPNLRLFQVALARAENPRDDLKPAIPWSIASPSTTPGFSAVGYYFGRALQARLGVPVGLIQTAVGGTPAEAWTPTPALLARTELKALVESAPEARRRFESRHRTWRLDAAVARAEGRTPSAAPRAPWLASELYNAMVHPLIGYRVRGAIWYQGEANASRAAQYRTLFPALIQSWRAAFGNPNLVFLASQLAPFQASGSANTEYAELREAQSLAARNLKGVGVAVITDVGEEKDIHPKKKQPVGERLALLARKLAYGEKSLPAHSPSVRRVRFGFGKVQVSFTDVAGGLVGGPDGVVRGFQLAGADGVFHQADARIVGPDSVEVRSGTVPAPKFVRFGFWNFAPLSLFTNAGLPAEPFRTDVPMKSKDQ